MRVFTVGIVALALAFFGSLINSGPAGAVSRCTISFDVNLMPRPVAAGNAPIDCRGRRSGPADGLTPEDLIPEIDLDVDVVG